MQSSMRMKLFAVMACVVGLQACEASKPVPASVSSESYLALKADYQAKTRGVNVPRAFIDSAKRDLETRLKAVIGPVSFDSIPAEYNPEWIDQEGEEGGELDAIRFGSLTSDRIILVTTPKILAAW